MRTILILDDDRVFRRLVVEALQKRVIACSKLDVRWRPTSCSQRTA